MSEDEQDRLVGATYRRMRAQQRKVACLRAKLQEIGQVFTKIGTAIGQERIRSARQPSAVECGGEAIGRVSASPEWETVEIPDRDELYQTLAECHAAQAALADAEARWEAVTT